MPPSPRRTEALSPARIVEVTIEILDTQGEAALTVRELTARLATGRGAIYYHVANKDELLASAADAIIDRVVSMIASGEGPKPAIRRISLGIFDAIDAHPWVGSQLSRDPGQPAVIRIWKAVGAQLHGLGLTDSARSDAGAALVNYVLGAAAQYAAGARRFPHDADRRGYLEAVATRWAHDETDPLAQERASLLLEHDDRKQFLAGVDIFLAGATGEGWA